MVNKRFLSLFINFCDEIILRGSQKARHDVTKVVGGGGCKKDKGDVFYGRLRMAIGSYIWSAVSLRYLVRP